MSMVRGARGWNFNKKHNTISTQTTIQSEHEL